MTTELDRVIQQQEAIVNHNGSAFVEACPGAGKTRTIVERLNKSSSKMQPRKGICVLSFTNTAVEEFKERCSKQEIYAPLAFPSYIATFDRFIYHFLVQPYAPQKLRLLDSWAGYKVGPFIRSTGRPLPAINLDSFSHSPSKSTLNLGNIEYQNRNIASQNISTYEQAANVKWKSLLQQGLISTEECRTIALRNINTDAGEAISKALNERFFEIIVDEAQDCNDVDLQIIEWLNTSNIQVIVVADPAQAIYEFRGSVPQNLSKLANDLGKLRIAGNFRSSKNICKLSATLRENSTPDLAVGDSANIDYPIKIFTYKNRQESLIGEKFCALIDQCGISKSKSIVLAHKRALANKAAGNSSKAQVGSSKFAQFSYWYGELNSSSPESRTHIRALEQISLWILSIEGKINSDPEPLEQALERLGISNREMRRKAVNFLEGIPSAIDATFTAESLLNTLREKVIERLDIPSTTSINTQLKKHKIEEVTTPLKNRKNLGLISATIHEAKGREYDAVCLTIPEKTPANELVLDLWSSGNISETIRVLFVGITRAKKLACIAIHHSQKETIKNLLDAAEVAHEVIAVK